MPLPQKVSSLFECKTLDLCKTRLYIHNTCSCSFTTATSLHNPAMSHHFGRSNERGRGSYGQQNYGQQQYVAHGHDTIKDDIPAV